LSYTEIYKECQDEIIEGYRESRPDLFKREGSTLDYYEKDIQDLAVDMIEHACYRMESKLGGMVDQIFSANT
jgi:hypothetical protein